MIRATARWIRRLVIGLVGMVVLVTGLVLIVVPGPAIIVIPLGLAILSLEFAWAGFLLRKLKERLNGEAGEERSEKPRPGGDSV